MSATVPQSKRRVEAKATGFDCISLNSKEVEREKSFLVTMAICSKSVVISKMEKREKSLSWTKNSSGRRVTCAKVVERIAKEKSSERSISLIQIISGLFFSRPLHRFLEKHPP